jgi:hypothetical protein
MGTGGDHTLLTIIVVIITNVFKIMIKIYIIPIH